MNIPIKLLTPTATIPTYQTDGAAGFDIASDANLNLQSCDTALIPTGLSIAIPDGYYLRISPRSGLAVRCGIDVLARVVDSDYRGEIKVMLINHGHRDFWIEIGDRIAQGVIMPVARGAFVLGQELPETGRGEGGFGSTGI